MKSDDLIFVKDLGFRYGADWVLKDIDFSIQLGDVLGIIGPNGSGKTTLLKILSGLFKPEKGAAYLRGEDLNKISKKRLAQHISIIPQENMIPFPYTVLEVVLMGRYPYLGGWSFEGKRDYDIAYSSMKLLEVDRFSDCLFSDLSGGEKQRVIIARALTQEPEILLLDEPGTFLDLQHQLGIQEIIQDLNQTQGMSLVLVSHDLNMASQLCPRLLLLDQGRMAHIGAPENVLTAEWLRKVYHCEVEIDVHPVTGKPRITPLSNVIRNG
jgi:iron complex transport system ATP-binding protein